jgi:hypothetical protein
VLPVVVVVTPFRLVVVTPFRLVEALVVTAQAGQSIKANCSGNTNPAVIVSISGSLSRSSADASPAANGIATVA